MTVAGLGCCSPCYHLPKSGAHISASHGLGGEDGYLMIDMKMFEAVSVDALSRISSVGGGGRSGNTA